MVMDDSNFRVSRSSAMPTTSTPAAAVAHLPVKSEETASSTITVNTTKNTNFPPPKTDKPRPHVCGTCQRSFARLEHLKRHERSHTKEKPFECPECSRCFARRDLLLRHQQKLHQTATPSSRPRNRRESAAAGSAAQSRARKNSVAGVAATNGSNAGNNNASMRPRANTISHVDNQHVQMIAAANANVARTMASGHGHGHSRHPSLIGLPMLDHTFGGMSTAMNHRGVPHGLKLETAQLSGDFNNNGLRTAPLTFTQEFDFEGMLFGPASTINPNALHYSDSPPSLAMEQASPYGTSLNETPSTAPFDDSFDWLTGFDHQMSFGNNENAVDGSSPSALSTTSQSGISDVMLDGSNHPAPAGTSSMWQPSVMGPPLSNPFAMDLSGSVFPDLLQGAPLSPQPATQKIHDPYLSAPPQSMSTLSPAALQGQIHPPQNVTHHSQGFSSTNAVLETPSSVNSGNHGASPVTTITDATRDAIVTALNQCLPFGGRKYSVPSGSPSAPRGPSPSPAQQITSTLPSTQDLQRYVGAYIAYFHPHLPFIHIPTLSFNVASSGSLVGGSGCLMLSMAAIGALYEMEPGRSLKIFDLAKKMIIFYLEGRRQVQARTADTRRASGSDLNTSYGAYESTSTPIWLVQAMLLNVVYGHNCGDKVAGDIASTHCAALVSLASAAELGRPAAISGDQDIIMSNSNPWKTSEEAENQKWIQWKTMEERKRTQYGVFIMSSLLVTAYNHTPALTNSEVHLDLPCDEEFFNADSSTDFFAKGGVEAANHNQMTFHDALGDLLRTNERQHRQHLASPTAASQTLTDLKPSAFGSFVLINALHNYIWETRQRHHNKLWTNEETEKMHRHIEPALKAWQAAWANNPKHSRERPNPHGAGPLSADSIPLLDLAYVRLFVDLSSAKEKFWQRDYDGVADELAQGNQIVQHAEHSPGSNSESNGSLTSDATYHSPVFDESVGGGRSSFPTTAMNVSRRERHLRKAAFYAADALSASEKLGVNFADLTSRELPLQSAICASDYVQVLAEWIATLQDRVGPHLGILGQDVVDFSSMPAAALLEEDDVKLLQMTRELIETSEMKINIEQMAVDNGVPGGALMTGEGGYATRLLKFTSFLFGRDCIWPVMHLLATCLETQSVHMRHRADLSIRGRPQLGA